MIGHGNLVVFWNEWPSGTAEPAPEREAATSSPSGPKPQVLPLVILAACLFAILAIASVVTRSRIIGAAIVLVLLFIAAKLFGIF